MVASKTIYETHLKSGSWKLDYDEIEQLSTGKHSKKKLPGSKPSMKSGSDKEAAGISGDASKSSGSQSKSMPTSNGQATYAKIGYYRGTMVAIKDVTKEHINVSRNVLKEFFTIRDLLHENVNPFIGACIEPPNIAIIWQYCHKGSIVDIIENDDVKLDNSFKLSMIADIARGMEYLHKSILHSHGNLKSTNCLVDNRWTVKITDYGLQSFLMGMGQKEEEDENYMFLRKQWTAPEILRENFPSPKGTQKGDVYSFAIITYEVCGRQPAFNFDNMVPRDAVNRVRNGEAKPFRPPLPDDEFVDISPKIKGLICNCWSENTEVRPTFTSIRKTLRDITGGDIIIIDMILSMMEKYSNNLEEIVDERTQQLNEEKLKTDKLLYRMLPA
ncbi:PREDICTED: resact receptor-like [Priapulus caudatus]|uniref:guanylate cyclase n=1 Tax=Priapulus caudatus TaxID=37621 RepID=A0ABM1EIN7_PRICU|nr:PREDICTED: resact receptor-like [Priapulus caudatus]